MCICNHLTVQNYLTNGFILTIIENTLINVNFTELSSEVLRTYTGVRAHIVLLHARENDNDEDDIPNDDITHITRGSISALIQTSQTLININTAIIPLKAWRAVTGVRGHSILYEGSRHWSLQ